ncbi:hypothetical protein ABZW18_13655 [Streptomyces sp. NPDC004647]|uniref:hypothetical protein n=1 Tax=Streptomyces sp. NPDC004647 TaxID=3154671 RepID=UPI0033BAC0D5
MSTPETSRFVRLRVELVLEVTDTGELIGAALDHIDGDESLPDDERGIARAAVQEDGADALAYLVDPFDLVSSVPGVELAQASWSSERIDYDPDAVEWGLDDDEEDGFGDVGWIGEDGERPDGEGDAGRP